MKPPSFDIREVQIDDVRDLFERFHAYRSTGNVKAYAFAVYESINGVQADICNHAYKSTQEREREREERAVAAFLWQPPPPGAARSVCEALPHGVLALSRMVAVPKDERRLRHISKPLRHQMRRLIDRTRWPVLVTYSDESVGHTGHVYKCSGWMRTERRKNQTLTSPDGRRVSRYANGKQADHNFDVLYGSAWMQRWEHWACTRVELDDEGNEKIVGDVEGVVALFDEHWERVPIPGKTWRSGAQAYKYKRRVT